MATVASIHKLLGTESTKTYPNAKQGRKKTDTDLEVMQVIESAKAETQLLKIDFTCSRRLEKSRSLVRKEGICEKVQIKLVEIKNTETGHSGSHL